MAAFVERGCDIASIDRHVRNKFRWDWLTEKDHQGDFLSDYIWKSTAPGKAFCTYCNDYLSYDKGGKAPLKLHSTSKKHVQKRQLKFPNQILPAIFQPRSQATGIPYGVAPNVNTGTTSTKQPSQANANVSIADRRSNLETTVLAFVAEHNLPLSLTPEVITLCQEMARDPVALNRIKMERTCATYKMTEGLHPALKEKLIRDLQFCPFSIYLDECSNNANNRILTILVAYYSEEEEKVVVRHYESIQLVYVNAKSVLDAVLQAFERDKIPLTNLISTLSDNAAYLSGKTSGFEPLLRGQAPHMLDIGIDTCHVADNIVKRFCNNFEGYHEKLLDDIYTDFKWSADLKEHLKDLCTILDITFVAPKQRRPHRWLSVYDCTLPIEKMLGAVTLLYLAWVPEEAFKTNSKVQKIYKEIMPKEDGKIKRVKEIHTELRYKNMTDEGKARQKLLVQRLFFDREKTLLYMYLYISVLERFKTHVVTFQTNEPLVHRLWDEQEDLLKEFLSYFVKMDVVNASRDLTTVMVKDQTIHCSTSDMYLGQCKEVLDKLDHTSALKSQFIYKVRAAYVATAEYMQQKLFSSPVFKCMSALDPKARGFNVTAAKLSRLVTHHFAPVNMLSAEEKADYEKEVRRLQIDRHLPKVEPGMRLDTWWTMVFRTRKFPCLAKIVKACLPIFVSPQVKVSFSDMNDIICAQTNKMEVKTFSALQNVRYYLKAKESQPKKQSKALSTSLKLFHREDVRTDPVDCKIARHMQKAHCNYGKTLTPKKVESNKKASQKRAATVETAKESPKKKKKETEISCEREINLM